MLLKVAKYIGRQILVLLQFLKIRELVKNKIKFFIANSSSISIILENIFNNNVLEKVNAN